jgi:uncharacterized protein (TIGR02145 family)
MLQNNNNNKQQKIMRTKIFFLFAMFANVVASAQVTNVEPVGANYATKTVSFRVWWNAGSRDATHLSKVWVWVDYIKVNVDNTTSGNTWTRAAVSAASPTASVSYDGSNRQGFWLQGNSGSYSATVTVQLNIAEARFNWCAYSSDYPPNVTAKNGTYTFKGTPPFTLIASDEITTQTVDGTTIATSALTITPTTIKDKTDCPGIFCPYQGSDLFIDATHLCQQRTSGAQNWEAWIKDTRDNEYYRIVLMPDNKWWLAQNVKYAGTGSAITTSGCTPDKCGRWYTGNQMSSTYTGSTGVSGYGANKQGICPNNWTLPVYDNWRAFVDAIHTVTLTQYNKGSGEWLVGTSTTINERLAAYNSPYRTGNDYYGWANATFVTLNNGEPHESWRGNSTQKQDWAFIVNHYAGVGHSNTQFTLSLTTTTIDRGAPVRCFRQL